MKNYSKPVSILAHIAQFVLWAGGIALVGILIWSFVNPDIIQKITENGRQNLDVLGFSVQGFNGSPAVFRMVVIYGILAMFLCGMIARNIYLISKSMIGKVMDDEHTPFTPNNVRMVREIGIFSIVTTVLGLIFSVITAFMAKDMEVVLNVNGILFGLVILWLSTIFAYGHRLQDDVDGLV